MLASRISRPAGAISIVPLLKVSRSLLRVTIEVWGILHIDVPDDEIAVTLPATSYSVTYYKPAILRSFSVEIFRRRMTIAFRLHRQSS